jgi:hypothetical protein
MILLMIMVIKQHLRYNYEQKFASELKFYIKKSDFLFLFDRKSDRHQKASECYRKSLKLNPFLWSSFEALCRLGKDMKISAISF